eukprot:7382662-Prymnesium_polylepis.2
MTIPAAPPACSCRGGGMGGGGGGTTSLPKGQRQFPSSSTQPSVRAQPDDGGSGGGGVCGGDGGGAGAGGGRGENDGMRGGAGETNGGDTRGGIIGIILSSQTREACMVHGASSHCGPPRQSRNAQLSSPDSTSSQRSSATSRPRCPGRSGTGTARSSRSRPASPCCRWRGSRRARRDRHILRGRSNTRVHPASERASGGARSEARVCSDLLVALGSFGGRRIPLPAGGERRRPGQDGRRRRRGRRRCVGAHVDLADARRGDFARRIKPLGDALEADDDAILRAVRVVGLARVPVAPQPIAAVLRAHGACAARVAEGPERRRIIRGRADAGVRTTGAGARGLAGRVRVRCGELPEAFSRLGVARPAGGTR